MKNRLLGFLCLLVILAGVAVTGMGSVSGDLWSSTVMTVSGAFMVIIATLLLKELGQ